MSDTASGWWDREHLRMLQPNLREVDADLSVDDLFEVVDRFHANALLLNTGGVCAFYPTDLEYHPRAEPLRHRSDGDLTGTVLERCRQEDVRLVARFDFSKFHESIFDHRPEWAYRDHDGEHVNYDGVVHACINGGYQQSYAFEILEEALSRYPVDGIFFNMFGYVESDYDGTYHGPCHCANCQERFAAFSDGDRSIPDKGYDAADHPVYQRFKHETATELLDRVRDHVDRITANQDEQVAVATYSERATDAVTDESNTGVDRALPRWQYSSVDNVSRIEDSWGKPAWNIVINAVDIPYRFQGVSAAEIRTRLFGALLRGGGLAYCVNGTFSGYPDPSNFPAAESAYDIASTYERTFQQLEPLASVALIRPTGWSATAEYRGWFRALAESHVQFHVRSELSLGRQDARPLQAGEYDVIILPETRLSSEQAQESIAQAMEAGTTVLATGPEFAVDAHNFLESAFGLNRESIDRDVRGAYLAVNDDHFAPLIDTGPLAIDDAFSVMEPLSVTKTQTALPFVTPGTFGPPERVGREGLEHTDRPGFLHTSHDGSGDAIYLPWGPGRLYHRHGFDRHSGVLTDVLQRARTAAPLLETNAPPTVEIALGTSAGTHILQLLNRSGFTGTSYHAPHQVSTLRIELPDLSGTPSLFAQDTTVSGAAQECTISSLESTKSDLTVEIESLGTYAAIEIV